MAVMTNAWTAWPISPALSDADGWNQPQYYSTIQCADIDGDGRVELLARSSGGVCAWKYDTTTQQWTALPMNPDLSDAHGWNQPQYYSTIQFADVNGDGRDELVARGARGIRLWKYDKTARQWSTLPNGPALSDANSWNQPQYYSTIQYPDVDGDGQAELLVRSSTGIAIWKDATSGQSADWLKYQSGSKLLSQMTIPGTHDSCAHYGGETVACQSMSLSDQLVQGIRFLDIRCRQVNGAFAIHHGQVYQHMNFDDVLNACKDFLNNHRSECIVMSVKSEYTTEDDDPSRTFEDVFDTYVAKTKDLWYLGDQIPSLDSVRGKIVLVRRFNISPATTVPVGIDASGWQDNTTFVITHKAVLHVQDEYVVQYDTNIKDKAQKVTNFLAQTAAAVNNDWYLNYSNGVNPDVAIPTPNRVALGAVTSIPGVGGIIPIAAGSAGSTIVSDGSAAIESVPSGLNSMTLFSVPGLSSVTNTVGSGISSAANTIGSDASNLANTVSSDVSNAVNTIGSDVSSATNTVSSGVSDVVNTVIAGASGVIGTVTSLWTPTTGVDNVLSDALDGYLATGLHQRLGTIVMDFPDSVLIRKIISMNGL